MSKAERYHLTPPPPEGTQVILRTLVGSTVHGTSVAQQDDRDEMAIAIPPPKYVVGLTRWETSVERTQPEGARSGPGDLDLVTYSLRKYAHLAAKGNPTILLPLYAPPTAMVSVNPYGVMLIQHRDLFVTRRAGKCFLGYLHMQRERMTGDRGQKRTNRPELIEAYGFDTKYAGHVIRLAHQGIELMRSGFLSLPMLPEARDEVVEVRTGKWTEMRVLARAAALERELIDAVRAADLPEEADTAKVDELLTEIHRHAWGWT